MRSVLRAPIFVPRPQANNGEFRAEVQSSFCSADAKFKMIEDMIQSHDMAQNESSSIISQQVEQVDRMMVDMDTLMQRLRTFAGETEAMIVGTERRVNEM